ncbi:hypothetical protein HJG60_009256 [Phyllostomus discolor]|uniref:Uncharacterized protein n=1 Tax=Phyllostomus discolor TaxID=89673 RepID=A0A833YMG9_9CHIR|nr:hypothetical protein HJG60_009256 [Phyllostomus discolor]
MQKVGFSGQAWCEGARPGSWGLGFWGSGPRSSIASVGGSPPSGEGSEQVGFFPLSPGSPKILEAAAPHHSLLPPPCPGNSVWWPSVTQPWKEESSLKWTAWPFDLKRLHGALRTMARRLVAIPGVFWAPAPLHT